MGAKYIKPNIRKYTSFDELHNDKDCMGFLSSAMGRSLTFDDLFLSGKSFIVTEPGYGKTRLLKEIVVSAESFGKHAIFVDLKKVTGDLDSFLQTKTDIFDVLDDKLDVNKATLFKTKGFLAVNKKDMIVCLDALDEVNTNEFPKVVNSIRELSKKYKRVSIFVTCRYHHFRKYQELFLNINFDFLKIDSFSKEQVNLYFENLDIPKQNIEQVIDILKFKGRDLVIQIPRYLEMLSSWMKGKDTKVSDRLTKAEIFEWFIYMKLETEENKTGFQKKEIIKRVLEKVALLMEIHQTNLLKKEELVSIFDDVKSNLNLSFLQQVPIELFYERTVLKDNIDTVEFENTEFQEYLAAKEILRLGRPIQVVFDLAVDQEIQEIFPSWYNTLSFIVDLDADLLKPLLDFGIQKTNIVEYEEYHRFLTSVNGERLTEDTRKQIFNNIFTYYQKVLHWIPYDVAEKLAFYFDLSQENILKNYENAKNNTECFVRKGNVAIIIGFLIEKKVFDEVRKQYWCSKLIEFASDRNSNGVLQRNVIFAISKFKNIELLRRIEYLKNTEDSLILNDFISACITVDPNNSFAISTFVQGTKVENIYARYGFYQITQKDSIKKMLFYFLNDEQFLFAFIKQENIFGDKDNKIAINIRKIWTKEFQRSLEKIVVKALGHQQYWFMSEKSNWLRSIILLLAEKDREFIFSLIRSIRTNKYLRANYFYLQAVFALILKKEQVSKFIQELKTVEQGVEIGLNTLLQMYYSKRTDGKEVFGEGEKYFRIEYKHFKDNLRKKSKESIEEARVLKEFRFKLEPAKGKYISDVFEYYLSNKDKIVRKWLTFDRKRLQTLLIDSILNKFDPGAQTLIIKARKPGGGKSYTTHAWIWTFGICLVIAQDLGINVSRFRKKIVGYIPFAYPEHLKAIFYLIPQLKKEEIDSLLTIYQEKRSDDLVRFMPTSFIDACKNYKISEAVTILKAFVDQTEFSIHERREALGAVVNIASDKKYLEEVFKRYVMLSGDDVRLAEMSNRYLIEKFMDTESIKWRLEEIKKKAAPFVQSNEFHPVGEFEQEFWEKKFAKPLMSISDPRYKKDFLSLLSFSFDYFKQEENSWRYVTYLWEIVFSYFNNLRGTRSYSHFREIEQYVRQNSCLEGINWFMSKLRELRSNYMDSIGKPQSIAECIKKYNRLKEVQYLDIATPIDLVNIIRDVIDTDLIHFIEDEGYYKVIKDVKGKQEVLIQKTLKTQFENSLLKRGFRKYEVDIRREEQLLDDKRTDFLVSYGFVGPILIELKRTDTPEVSNYKKRQLYKAKLLQYVEGYKAHFCFFILFQIKKNYPLDNVLSDVRSVYKDCNKVEVKGLNCIKS